MRKVIQLATIALLIGLCSDSLRAAQEPVRGEWESGVNRWNGIESLYVCLKSSSLDGRSRFSNCFDTHRENLKGLNFTPSSSVSAPAHLELIRDAGTFILDGQFQNGKGGGEYRFQPSADYVAGMKALGYGELSLDQVFNLALRDVSRDFINSLKSLGYNELPLDGLVRLRDHGVSIAFITDMKALGYSGLSLDDLVRLRDHGVSAKFASELARLGYKDRPIEELVRLRDHGVSTKFMQEMKAAG